MKLLTVLIAALVVGCVAEALLAQNVATVRSGAYTAQQATDGESAFNADCAGCHGTDLGGKGRNMPGLSGEEFLAGWRELSVGDLFDKIQETMPAGKAGSLPRERTAAILAYILSKNSFPAGTAPLPSDKAALAKLAWK